MFTNITDKILELTHQVTVFLEFNKINCVTEFVVSIARDNILSMKY